MLKDSRWSMGLIGVGLCNPMCAQFISGGTEIYKYRRVVFLTQQDIVGTNIAVIKPIVMNQFQGIKQRVYNTPELILVKFQTLIQIGLYTAATDIVHDQVGGVVGLEIVADRNNVRVLILV